MADYESFKAAETALENFAGANTKDGFRPMTPYERQQAQQLLKDRKEDVTKRGKEGIAKQRQGVRAHGQTLVSRYDAAERLLDELEEDIEDGTISVEDHEKALADAARLHRTLAGQVDQHVANADAAAQDHDPEAFVRDLYKRYPALRKDGRQSPWSFPW